MTEIKTVLERMMCNDDLPNRVMLTRDHGLLKKGEVFQKIAGDPMGSYANQDGNWYVLPHLVSNALRNGLMVTQEEARKHA